MRLLPGVLVVLATACADVRSHTVEMRGFAYVPAELEVSPGDTIEFVNRDVVPHTATAESWSSGTMAAGAAWRVVAPDSGVIEYVCDLHPSMRGRISVH